MKMIEVNVWTSFIRQTTRNTALLLAGKQSMKRKSFVEKCNASPVVYLKSVLTKQRAV